MFSCRAADAGSGSATMADAPDLSVAKTAASVRLVCWLGCWIPRAGIGDVVPPREYGVAERPARVRGRLWVARARCGLFSPPDRGWCELAGMAFRCAGENPTFALVVILLL